MPVFSSNDTELLVTDEGNWIRRSDVEILKVWKFVPLTDYERSMPSPDVTEVNILNKNLPVRIPLLRIDYASGVVARGESKEIFVDDCERGNYKLIFEKK